MLTTVEKRSLQAFRRGAENESRPGGPHSLDQWLGFGIREALIAGQIVRAARFSPARDIVRFKDDGTPFLPLEREIEEQLRERLSEFAPDADVVGEETRGSINNHGISVAIDPVDGTWSLINHCETHATSLAFFQDSHVFLGMVSNAVTGEIAYALKDQPGRLIQLSSFGEEDAAFELPLGRVDDGTLLVNVHPVRTARRLVDGLLEVWDRGEVSMVKATGGSPAWALLEAAKGSFVYINTWPGKAADPYDLAAGIQLVRASGGDVVNIDGDPIEFFGHRGPFVAGIDSNQVSAILAIVKLMNYE